MLRRPVDERGRCLLFTLGPLLPVTAVGAMFSALSPALKRAGFTDVGIGGDLQVWGRLPGAEGPVGAGPEPESADEDAEDMYRLRDQIDAMIESRDPTAKILRDAEYSDLKHWLETAGRYHRQLATAIEVRVSGSPIYGPPPPPDPPGTLHVEVDA